MSKLALVCLFAIAAAAFASFGCATNDDTPKPPRERYRTIPHSQPQSWEGNPFGGMMPQSQ